MESDFALKASVPNGFSYLNKLRPHDFRGGGVATIYRKDIKCKEMQNDTHFKSFEQQTNEAKMNGTKCIFAVVYRTPPSQSNRIPKRRFISEFAKYLEPMVMKKQHLVIFGDFNIHWDIKSDSETKEISDLFETFGLAQRINGPTHTYGHTLDWVISRKEQHFGMCHRPVHIGPLCNLGISSDKKAKIWNKNDQIQAN